MADEGAKVLVTDVQDTAKAVKAITDAGGVAMVGSWVIKIFR